MLLTFSYARLEKFIAIPVAAVAAGPMEATMEAAFEWAGLVFRVEREGDDVGVAGDDKAASFPLKLFDDLSGLVWEMIPLAYASVLVALGSDEDDGDVKLGRVEWERWCGVLEACESEGDNIKEDGGAWLEPCWGEALSVAWKTGIMLNDIERRLVAFESCGAVLSFLKLPLLMALGEGGDCLLSPACSLILGPGGEAVFFAEPSSMYSMAADISGPSTNCDVR
jgi:hypothetical protein